MGQYIVNRLGQTVLVIILSSMIIFSLVRLIPGDPAELMAPEDASIEEVAAVREELGLNGEYSLSYQILLD